MRRRSKVSVNLVSERQLSSPIRLLISDVEYCKQITLVKEYIKVARDILLIGFHFWLLLVVC